MERITQDSPLDVSLHQERFATTRTLQGREGRYLAIQASQIAAGNGEVTEGIFVDKPGYLDISHSQLSDPARELFAALSVDDTASDGEQLAQALSHETYFTFPKTTKAASHTIEKVVQEAGHRSVSKPNSVTSLIAGISIDAAIPLVAAGGGIGRLTSSNTKAMSATLYRRLGDAEQTPWQTEAIQRLLELRNSIRGQFEPECLSDKGVEFFNMFNATSKTVALFHTMNVKELHKLAYRLLGDAGHSEELATIAHTMTSTLAKQYPGMLEAPEFYLPDPQRGKAAAKSNHLLDKSTLVSQIDANGGIIEKDLFVMKPAISIAEPGSALLKRFRDECSPEYLRLLPVQFSVSGIAYETLLELIAHSEASVSTFAQVRPLLGESLYRVQGNEAERKWQMEGIKRFLSLREAVAVANLDAIDSTSGRELYQHFDLGSRAIAVTFTMSLADYHSLFIGRLAPHGNEADVQTVCREMCETLHSMFPDLIAKPEEYREMGNETKYSSAAT